MQTGPIRVIWQKLDPAEDQKNGDHNEYRIIRDINGLDLHRRWADSDQFHAVFGGFIPDYMLLELAGDYEAVCDANGQKLPIQ